MKTAIVTGANGFIGSHVAYGLIEKGWRVHALGRSRQAERWSERLNAALREVGEISTFSGDLLAYECDLETVRPDWEWLPSAGSSAPDTMLFHLAGDTRFTPADPKSQRKANIQTPLNLVTALRGRIGRVVHVSTAYVAGKRTGLVQETELNCGQGFWNTYEQSKFEAEKELASLCKSYAIPLIILRPAIVINDRRTGRASTFTHLNALVEVVSRIQNYYGIEDGQVVSESVRLVADPEARPNLVAIDSIIPPMLRIAESTEAEGKVFHLCHPQPQPNRQIIELISDAFQVKGKLRLEFVREIAKPLSHTEEMITRSLKSYTPYLNGRCEFDLSNSRALVPDYDAGFSQLDVAGIQRIIEFQRGVHKRARAARRQMG